MKLSIIFPVLNSHEIVRRQDLHFAKMGLPNDIEILYIDDGSDPPIESPNVAYRTNDKRPWTWALARNKGARVAKGEYMLMADLDYIIPKDVIMTVYAFDGDYMSFKREFGVLDENGNFIQDIDVLASYGWDKSRHETRGFSLPPHPNDFVIRRALFFQMGQYREDLVEKPYPQGEDNEWKKRRKRWEVKKLLTVSNIRPTIYMFPNGRWCGDLDYNPFDLFHNTTRKTKANPFR